MCHVKQCANFSREMYIVKNMLISYTGGVVRGKNSSLVGQLLIMFARESGRCMFDIRRRPYKFLVVHAVCSLLAKI